MKKTGGKSAGPPPLSGYKGMWLFILFDLPMTTPKARKAYTRFRKGLVKEGFSMLQYSVYARYYASEEASEKHRKKVRATLPEEGEVRMMAVTDHQFGKMENFSGKRRADVEKPPQQLTLF